MFASAPDGCHYSVTADGFVDEIPGTPLRSFRCAVWWQGVPRRHLGIHLAGGGLPVLQLAGLCDLCLDLTSRHAIPPWRIAGLGDMAPDATDDPGAGFPWRDLAEQGVGLWAEVPDPGCGEVAGDATTLRQALATIGYRVPRDQGDLTRVLRAFQRRFRPEAVTGTADLGTRARVAAMAALTQARMTGM